MLSTLRKKFKQVGNTENGFIASGSNYKVNYRGELIDTGEQQQKDKQEKKDRVLQSVKTAIAWAMVGAVTLMAYIKINEKPSFTLDNIIQATSISGVSIEPALSPDGSAMVFSHKKESSSQIYLKVDANLNFQALTDSQYYDQVAAWSPSGRQLAFQRIGPQLCQIRVMQLDEQYQKPATTEKWRIATNTPYLSSISWETRRYFVFSPTPAPNMAHLTSCT